jgi:hypothetical protein
MFFFFAHSALCWQWISPQQKKKTFSRIFEVTALLQLANLDELA